MTSTLDKIYPFGFLKIESDIDLLFSFSRYKRLKTRPVFQKITLKHKFRENQVRGRHTVFNKLYLLIASNCMQKMRKIQRAVYEKNRNSLFFTKFRKFSKAIFRLDFRGEGVELREIWHGAFRKYFLSTFWKFNHISNWFFCSRDINVWKHLL